MKQTEPFSPSSGPQLDDKTEPGASNATTLVTIRPIPQGDETRPMPRGAMPRVDETAHPRWWMALVAGIILLLCIAAAWAYSHQKAQQQTEVAGHLSAIAELKVMQIVAWRQERSADAAVLMEREYLRHLIQDFLKQPDPEVSRQIAKRLRTVKERYHYSDILLVDPDKQVRLRLLPKETGPVHEGYGAAMAAAMESRTPAWTSVHTGGGLPIPHLGVVAPLFAPGDSAKPLGALVLICDTQHFLNPLIQSWPTQSETAETLIVRREGDDLVYLSDLRQQPGTALTRRTPLTRTTLPEVMAVTGRKGFVMGTDYRGAQVAAVVLPIPDSPWFLVAKIDLKEAFAEWRMRLVMTLLLIFIAMGLVVVIGLVFRQHSLKRHYRDLYHSESALSQAMQRHSITLQSIGDGVIATDARGRIELINRVAEKITGWPQAEAVGRSIEEVFRIIDEETRNPVENPVTRVLLKECGIVSLTGNTLLIARDGSEIPIADSGAPIRDDQGQTVGVVLVFKDRTREREFQKKIIESEEKYRHIADNSLDVIWTMDLDLVFTYVNPAVYPLAGFTREEWTGSRLQAHCDEENFAIMAEVIAEEMARGPDGKGVIFEAVMLKKNGEPLSLEIRGKVNHDADGRPVSLQGVTRDISRRIEGERERQKLQEQLYHALKMESVGRLAGGVAHDYNNILSVIIGYTELSLDQVTPDNPIHPNLQEIHQAALRSKAVTRQLLAFARKEAIVPEVLDLNATVEGMLTMIRRLIGEHIDMVWLPGAGLWPVCMDPSQIDQILANLCVNARDAIETAGKVTIETANRVVDTPYPSSHGDAKPGDYVCLSVCDDGCGMTREMVKNIFEPFFTTKEVGKGTGLGLATVYGIVQQNEGFINVYSEPGAGTSFRVFLPRCREAVETDDIRQQDESPVGRGERILVVEDEPAILELTRSLLTRQGYVVLTADTPAQALDLAKRHAGDIALLITDVIMPEMNGRRLAEQLQSFFPRLKLLFMSGYSADIIARSGVVEAGVNFIQKPFSLSELARKVSVVLNNPSP